MPPVSGSIGAMSFAEVKFPEAVLRTAKRKAEELGAISGRHQKSARGLTTEELATVERIQGAKSPEEFPPQCPFYRYKSFEHI